MVIKKSLGDSEGLQILSRKAIPMFQNNQNCKGTLTKLST